MKKTNTCKSILLTLAVAFLLALAGSFAFAPGSRAAAEGEFSNPVTPVYGLELNPSDVTYSRVSFFVSSASGLTKDSWDGSLAYNSDLIYVTYTKDGETKTQTIPEIKNSLGDDAIKRTCYTYESTTGGNLLHLVMHMDNHSLLSPSDISAVTVKAGFQWCAGSTSGITGTVENVGLNEDVTFHVSDNIILTPFEYSLSLLDLGKEYTDANGSNFSSDNTLFVFWAQGSQSGSTWGALNLTCGETAFGDLVQVHTATQTYTLSQLQKSDLITRVICYGDMFGINLEEAGFGKSQVVGITLKAGLAPITGSDGWSDNDSTSGTADMTKALEADVSLVLGADSLYELAATSISVKTAPAKVSYVVGESFDPSGMTILASLYDGSEKEIAVTQGMCSYDFTDTEGSTVTVSYGCATLEYTVSLSSVAIESLTVTGDVTVAQFETPSYDNLSVTANYADGSESSVPVSSCEISGVDPWTKGEQTATLTYQGLTADFSVTVTDPDTSKGMFIVVDSAYSTNNSGLAIYVSFLGIDDVQCKALWGIDALEGSHVLDYLYLDGVSCTNLKEQGKVTRVNTYGSQIRVNMDSSSYTASDVQRVTFKAGFQWVSGSADSWGTTNTSIYYNAEGAVIKEDITLYNLGTGGWTIAAEKAEISSPAEKTEFVQGEDLDVTGLTLKITLTNGDTKSYTVTASDVSGYDKSTLGTQTLTVQYQDVTATYSVTVAKPAATLVSAAVDSSTVPDIQWFAVHPDFSAIRFVLTLSNESTVVVSGEYVGGLDTSVLGTQKAVFKVTYGTKVEAVEVEITVKDNDRTKYITAGETELKTESARNNFYFIEFTVSDAVVGEFKAYWNFQNLGNNGDYVLVNGKTLNELLADEANTLVARGAVYGKKVGFYFDNGTDGLVSIAFLKGFELFQLDKDYWGSTPSDANAVSIGAILKEDLYFVVVSGTLQLVKEVDSMSLASSPKTEYNMGDVIDLSGLTLSVLYRGAASAEEIAVTRDMCSYDFTESGTQTVTISFHNKTISFDVTVNPVAASAIRILALPEKVSYDFAIDGALVLDGLEVVVDYVNVETNQVVKTEKLDAANLVFDGFDPRLFGVQTIMVLYGELETEFDITVENISKNKYLSIDYAGAYTSYESTQLNSLMVQVVLNGVYDDPKPLWGIDRMDYVAEYILITYLQPDGTYATETARELIEKGWLTRINAWTTQLVFNLDTIYLLPCSWVDKRTDPTNPDEDKIHYVEGVSSVITSVTFLPGFQWYTSVDGANHWGDNENGPQYYRAISGAVIKEKVTLENIDGYGWIRPLKTDENGNIASDALTIKSLPSKTVYTVGETLNIQGLVLQAQYADGGVEDLTVGYSDITGYDKNLVGEQTLTVDYAGASVTFTVTVQEEGTEQEKSGGCGASLHGGFAFLAFAFVAAAAGVILLCKKRKSE